MSEAMEVVKAVVNAGVAGLIVWLLYRLVDKWAPRFLAAHQAQATALTEQATAMTDMAKAVREGAKSSAIW